MADNDSFGFRLVKSPLVWSGVGLLLRYSGDSTPQAGAWTGIGVVSLSLGVMLTIATHPSTPTSRQLP